MRETNDARAAGYSWPSRRDDVDAAPTRARAPRDLARSWARSRALTLALGRARDACARGRGRVCGARDSRRHQSDGRAREDGESRDSAGREFGRADAERKKE